MPVTGKKIYQELKCNQYIQTQHKITALASGWVRKDVVDGERHPQAAKGEVVNRRGELNLESKSERVALAWGQEEMHTRV